VWVTQGNINKKSQGSLASEGYLREVINSDNYRSCYRNSNKDHIDMASTN